MKNWKRVVRWTAAGVSLALAATFGIAYWRSSNSCDDPDAAPPSHPMKAIVYCDYGSSEVLRLEDVEKPSPDDDQLLVKVTALSELLQAGTVTPVIDRRYPLSDVPAAIGYLEAGHARGKVIIDVD